MYRLRELTWLAAEAIRQRALGEVGSVPKRHHGGANKASGMRLAI
jgi:hypothetical protein